MNIKEAVRKAVMRETGTTEKDIAKAKQVAAMGEALEMKTLRRRGTGIIASNVYAGTVPAATVTKRRKANKIAKASRRKNR